MKFFQNITLRPDAEISPAFLWGKVFQQLHLALVEIQDEKGQASVGIALPDYDARRKMPLGLTLRLLAPDEMVLETLNVRQWLARLQDYAHVTAVRPVPSDVTKYACYQRQQPKSSLERLARRKAKRHNLSMEEAVSSLGDFKEAQVNTPYIQMSSHSSKQKFRLFIAKQVASKPTEGKFSTYGLSIGQSTVPEF